MAGLTYATRLTRRLGLGVNAKFSQYGEYLERMVEAVSQRWNALCASRSYSESSTHVVIEFKVTREGLIKDIATIENTSQALGVLLAQRPCRELRREAERADRAALKQSGPATALRSTISRSSNSSLRM